MFSCLQKLKLLQIKSIIIPFLLIFMLGIPDWFFPQTKKPKEKVDDTIRLLAKNQEKKGDMVLASGGVELHFQEVTLLADQIEINTSSYEVTAEGQVTLQLPSEVIFCERLTYNLKTHEGKLENVKAIARPTMLFGAKAIYKSTNDLYNLEKAWFTSCSQPVPRWSFSFSSASLRPEDYITMRGAIFRVKNLPLFYFPYIRYPLKERASGFLIPQLGFNKIKGISLSQSFYWAISRNTDLTLTGDIFTKQGIGTGLDYRYFFSSYTKGEIQAYIFAFTHDPKGIYPKHASMIKLNHMQNLPFGFRLNGQVDFSNSFNFLREFDDNFSTATINNRSYSISLAKSWSLFSFNLRSSRYETYFPQTGQSTSSSYLPQFSLNLLKLKIYRSLSLSWESGFTNQHYSYQNLSQGQKSYNLGNIFYKPELELPIIPFPWLNLNISGGANFNYYLQTYQPGTTTRVDQPMFTSQLIFDFKLEGPIFYRIFFKEGEPYLKHMISPFIDFNYESSFAQQIASRIISPFGFIRNDELKFGIIQHLIKKTQDSSEEFLTLGISQKYYFDPSTSEIKRYYPIELDRNLSPVNIYLRYYPKGRFNLDISADFNTYEKNFLSFNLNSSYGAPEDNIYISLNWSKSYMMFGSNSFFYSNQIGLKTHFRWPEKFELSGEIQRDLQRKKQIYTGIAATYHYQCLDFSFDLRIYYYRAKPETQFRFSIGLGNISKSTSLLGTFGF